MSEQKSKEKNNKKGIITILFSIMLLTIIVGGLIWYYNKPLNQMQDVKEESKIVAEKRKAIMKVQARLVNVENEEGKIDIEKLNNNLSQIEGIENWKAIENLPTIIIVDGYRIEINENLQANLSEEENSQRGITLKIEVGQVAKEESTINGKEKGYNNPVIPKGFKAINTEKAVWTDPKAYQNGLVIEDATGDKTTNESQFVWIPVQNYKDFHLIEGYSDKKLSKMLSKGLNPSREAGSSEEELLPGKPNKNNTVKGTKESIEMYKSVKENGGFYISRFEAGIKDENKKDIQDGSIKPVSKKQNVWNNISWGGDIEVKATDVLQGNDKSSGAVKVARSMYNNPISGSVNKRTTVKSTLCYGVQWDAVLNFIDASYVKGKAEGYLKDSTNKGNYESDIEQTGSSEEYMKKNIYDIAGNVSEWTMEAFETQYRVIRGGNYKGIASMSPASVRYIETPSKSDSTIGFRVALYL